MSFNPKEHYYVCPICRSELKETYKYPYTCKCGTIIKQIKASQLVIASRTCTNCGEPLIKRVGSIYAFECRNPKCNCYYLVEGEKE